MIHHKKLTGEKWSRYTLLEQLGNVGSEVGRAVSCHLRGEIAYHEKAVERALELLDLTIADPRWKNRLKEIVRAREVLCDIFYGDRIYQVSFEELEKYFFEFAYAARRKR